MANIGETIRTLRLERGLTQKQLGDILGVTKATVNKYENGAILNLKSKTITMLAKVFNIHPISLLGWDETHDSKLLALEIRLIEHSHSQFKIQLARIISGVNPEGLEKILDYAECVANMEEYNLFRQNQ